MNFVIWCPMAWTDCSGGIVALHKLCHNLALLGENSFITASVMNPDYYGNQITEEQAMRLDRNSTIVIYPEIVYGNPLNAKYVMRWLLNTPGAIAYRVGEGEDGPDDLIYKYASIYKAKDESKVKGELRAIGNHWDTFQNEGLKRSGSCYIVKKGKNDNSHPGNAICLDDYENLGGNKYLAEVFNQCAMFISYDNATFLNVLAALCGCISIVIPNTDKTAQQWYHERDAGLYGIAYGYEEIPHAIETMHLVKPMLMEEEKKTLEQAKEFIAEAYRLVLSKSEAHS